MNLKKSFIH